MSGAEMEPLEREFIAGAISAIRRRAERQAQTAKFGTVIGERDAVIRTGEAAVAVRLAEALGTIADDLDRDLEAAA
jgi:hypothetical protein